MMKLFWIAALLIVVTTARSNVSLQVEKGIDCDCVECDFNAMEMIQYWGYPAEDHSVTCDDGFVLHMFRIPYGINSSVSKSTPRTPVLLQHGLLDSSITWTINQPFQSLAFILADAGFDVWMGNNRGNVYSPPSCDTESCWDFTFDEMAKYDLPANVEYVLKTTGFETLSFVGHSQGITHALASLSTKSQLKSKINLVVALAPVAFLEYQRYWLGFVHSSNALVLFRSGLLSVVADLGTDRVIQQFGFNNFLPSSDATEILGNVGIRI
jgi:pimeloyl-ACP methyl ester carboxylesterase